jgi:hypothetical protein
MRTHAPWLLAEYPTRLHAAGSALWALVPPSRENDGRRGNECRIKGNLLPQRCQQDWRKLVQTTGSAAVVASRYLNRREAYADSVSMPIQSGSWALGRNDGQCRVCVWLTGFHVSQGDDRSRVDGAIESLESAFGRRVYCLALSELKRCAGAEDIRNDTMRRFILNQCSSRKPTAAA